jgi:hypothetical protein
MMISAGVGGRERWGDSEAAATYDRGRESSSLRNAHVDDTKREFASSGIAAAMPYAPSASIITFLPRKPVS